MPILPDFRARHRRSRSHLPPRRARPDGVDPQAAEDFVRLFHAEEPSAGPVEPRLEQVHREIETFGTYEHTAAELEFGGRVAWRNAARCLGRLSWRELTVRDRRHVRTADEVAAECVEHLREATNGGRIRPVLTVFPAPPAGEPGISLWNDQLVRYAGYRRRTGRVRGDPAQVPLTEAAQRMGWRGGAGTAFDVLPLIVETPTEGPVPYELPEDAVLQVPIRHPDLPWFADLGLRWHAVPAVSNMPLEIGGVVYTAAPFNGWYMGTEIGARNLADTGRYDLLPEVARRLGLDTSSNRTLWKDSALVELNVAVLHSFERAGVTITDHHTESERFLTHLAREEEAGRRCPADWSWIVPPMSGSTTPVFHRYYDDVELSPSFLLPDRIDPRARLTAWTERLERGEVAPAGTTWSPPEASTRPGSSSSPAAGRERARPPFPDPAVTPRPPRDGRLPSGKRAGARPTGGSDASGAPGTTRPLPATEPATGPERRRSRYGSHRARPPFGTDG